MTEKELRKLNRYQLLELLVIQTERADKLQSKLDTAEKALNAKDLRMTAMGSIAEASLQLSGIFDAADKAADLLLDGARTKAEQIEEEARQEAEKILQLARQEAEKMLDDARSKSLEIYDDEDLHQIWSGT